jgi:hypothetical protein
VNAFWQYFWPLFALGLVLGGLFGTLAFRRRRRMLFVAGGAIALAGAVLWHWPLGAADRLTQKVESTAEFVLNDWEMGGVEGRLRRDPLSRKLHLSGPADEFQREQLVLIMGTIPGVSSATWSSDRGVPLIVEAAGAALLGFLIGLLLAYLVELRRRYNAQWSW